jgi:hypothetical protein
MFNFIPIVEKLANNDRCKSLYLRKISAKCQLDILRSI